MDLLALKLALPQPVPWPGGQGFVELRPLPDTARQAAQARAGARLRAHEAQDTPLAPAAAERAVQTLAAASGLPADELRAGLYEGELAWLYERWLELQAASEPNVELARTAFRKGVHRSVELRLDGLFAHEVESPVEFYGRPVVELTFGQLVYFQLVRAAYREYFVPDEKGNLKKVSRRWVESE